MPKSNLSNFEYKFVLFSMSGLEVGNEIIESGEQVIIAQRQDSHNPVIVRPATDWEICQPPQSPHHQVMAGEATSSA